jgi:hypothetical protein
VRKINSLCNRTIAVSEIDWVLNVARIHMCRLIYLASAKIRELGAGSWECKLRIPYAAQRASIWLWIGESLGYGSSQDYFVLNVYLYLELMVGYIPSTQYTMHYGSTIFTGCYCTYSWYKQTFHATRSTYSSSNSLYPVVPPVVPYMSLPTNFRTWY